MNDTFFTDGVYGLTAVHPARQVPLSLGLGPLEACLAWEHAVLLALLPRGLSQLRRSSESTSSSCAGSEGLLPVSSL